MPCNILVELCQRSAFDKIDWIALWNELLKSNICGKLLKVIQSKYVNIKSCVSSNNYKSDFFLTNIGIRQCENLSPLMFALFVNDFEEFLISKDCKGVDIFFWWTTWYIFYNTSSIICWWYSTYI